jgi:tetratricopeptide (TPR) repeat protein
LVEEARGLVREIDALRGARPAFELAVTQVCRLACLDAEDGLLKGQIWFLLARSLIAANEWTEAETRLSEAEQYFSSVGDAASHNLVNATRATLALATGNPALAVRLYPTVISEFSAREDDLNEASALLGYGQALFKTGDPAAARATYTRAIEIFRASGRRLDEYKCLVLLADTAGDPAEEPQLLEYLTRAAAVARTVDVDPDDRIRVLERLAAVAARAERFNDAEQVCKEGVDLARRLKNVFLEGFFEGNLGSVLSQTGDIGPPLAHLERSLTLARQASDSEGIRIAEHNIAEAKRQAKARSGPSATTSADTGKPAAPAVGDRRRTAGSNSDTAASSRVTAATVKQLASVARSWRSSDQRDRDRLAGIAQPANTQAADAVVEAVLDLADQTEQEDVLVAATLVMATENWLEVPAGPRTTVRLYSQLGSYAMRGSDMEGARRCFEAAATVAQQSDLPNEFVAVTTNLGTVLRQSGLVLEATQAYGAAIEASSALEPSTQAMVLINASTAWSDLGQHERSAGLSGRAVQILRGERDGADMLLVALINQGGALFGLGHVAEAENAMSEALNLARTVNNPAQEGVALGHLGLIQFSQGAVADAIRYLEGAASTAEQLKDLWNAQHWYRDLGNAYAWTGFDAAAEASFEKALELSRRVGDRRSEAVALLGIAVATRNGKQAQDKLKASWELAIATGNGAVALQAACRGVEFAIRRAVGLTELSIDQLELLSGGFQLRDREAFEDAKRWLNEARRWHEALGAKTYDAPLQMAEAQVLRLEGRAKDAIDVLVSSLDDSHGLSRSAREAGIGLLYFKDLGRPDLALPFLERALADWEQVASTLRGQAHRLGMRDETAQLSIWTIDCALALGETERAFAVLERGKALELRRLLGLDSQEAVSAPTLAKVAHRLEGRQAAFVCFTLSPQSARAFVATPGKVHDPLEIPLGLEQLSKLWLSLQETYGKARSPAAAFDTRLVGDWHRELQRACTVIGSALASGVVALLEEHGTKELILVPQTMLHAFPLHAAVLPDGTTMADRFVTGYAVSATEFLGRGREPVRGAPAVCVAFADSLGDLPLAQFETTLPNAWRASQETYLGGEVTKDRIIAKLAEADWLHFACHARHVLADNDMTGIYVADAARRRRARHTEPEVDCPEGKIAKGLGCRSLGLRNRSDHPAAVRRICEPGRWLHRGGCERGDREHVEGARQRGHSPDAAIIR